MYQQARLTELSSSYLEHVLIVLRANDQGASLRDFLDPWWSFTRGGPFIRMKRTGHLAQHTMNDPCVIEHGARLPNLDWISEGARAALKRGVRKKQRVEGDVDSRLIVEHSVPLKVIRQSLFDRREEWTLDSLRTFLDHHYRRALLTQRENKLLIEAGLDFTMPNGWQTWGDPYARYDTARITQSTLREAA